MEVVIPAIGVEDWMLDRAKEFEDVFVIDSEDLIGQVVEGLVVDFFFIERLPASA